MPPRAPIRERILRNVVADVGGCWRWKGEKRTGGYGYIEIDGDDRRVHRVAYEEFHGPIPDGLVVMHSCDVRDCVNPAHLSVGTQAENNRQIVERQRHGNQWRKQLDDQGAAWVRANREALGWTE